MVMGWVHPWLGTRVGFNGYISAVYLLMIWTLFILRCNVRLW